LTQMAGLGWLSASGLIVTPEHGPRVRLAAVFTNIENLPFSTHNDHAWVEDFCAECRICIRQCPAEAILPEPTRHVHIPVKSSTSSGDAVHPSERSDASMTIIPSSGRHRQGRVDLAT
jgi:epoxyqueuosine reductase QueG